MKNKFFNLLFSFGIALFICFVISVVSFNDKSESIRNEVFRMHIVADSDSNDDQLLKLKVRDEVLSFADEYLKNAKNKEQAEQIIKSNKDEIVTRALKVINENGYNYSVDVKIGKCFFPTKTYNNSVTLPAGEYDAVNVIIGEGKGHNWWCVMFPPMCLPCADAKNEIKDYLSTDEQKLVNSKPELEPRFKIVEIIEKFKENYK